MKKRFFKVMFRILIVILIFYGYYFLYRKYKIGIPCIFHKLTGLLCPGCGITRCLFSLIEGKFYQAFCYNQLVFILWPFIILYVLYRAYLYITDSKDMIICKIPNRYFVLLLIVVLLFGIGRNII